MGEPTLDSPDERSDNPVCSHCGRSFKKRDRYFMAQFMNADTMYRWKERAHVDCFLKACSGGPGTPITGEIFEIEKDEFSPDEEWLYDQLREIWRG